MKKGKQTKRRKKDMNKKDRKEQQETIAKWKKRSQRLQTALRLTLLVLTVCSSTMPIAFANSALDSINNLSDFIFSALKAIGMIILGFGVLQVGFEHPEPRCQPAEPRLPVRVRRPGHLFRQGHPGSHHGLMRKADLKRGRNRPLFLKGMEAVN